MRVRYVTGAKDFIIQYPDIVIQNYTDYYGHWNKLFDNDHNIELEIGMGKGQFIIKKALCNPDINYIGIDKDISIVYKALKNVLVHGEIKNLKLICADAISIHNIFEKEEIEKIYLNFSDPWPKVRHEKRRLTGPIIFKTILDIQRNGIEFKTDNRHLFEYSIMEFNKLGLDIVRMSLNLHEDDKEVITTEYEDKFSSLGQPIYFCEVRKK